MTEAVAMKTTNVLYNEHKHKATNDLLREPLYILFTNLYV
jgi:hypothetical protein